MNILIIEDDENKLEQLRKFIFSFSDFDVKSATSFRSGLDKLREGSWDYVLLDMQLPTYDKTPTESGGRQRPFAGEEILRRMKREELAPRVIIVTQFVKFGEGQDGISLDQLKERLKTADFPNYISLVYYHAKLSDWKRELKTLLV